MTFCGGKTTDQTCEIHVSYGSDARTVQVRLGQRLMQALKEAGLPILGDCGGACTCATCHIYVEPGCLERLPTPGPNEAALLDVVDEPLPLSRLACQIEVNERLGGISISLAPGSY